MEDARTMRRALEEERITPDDALAPLVAAAHHAESSRSRIDAYRVIGAIAGRSYGASWDIAERAAFALLDLAREADAPEERIGLLLAMGRAFRNVWLMPYVHTRLSDGEESVVRAAIAAAGGLAFPALEETLASSFLGESASRKVRLAAIAALGRMGAESAASRLAPFIRGDAAEAATAIAALTEIRSRAGEEAAIDVLGREPSRDVLVAAVRYLAEMGRAEVLPVLRRIARDEDPELRILAGLASRAYDAEKKRDADERILAALTERDRAVRAALARRLRTLPVADVLAQAELLLRDDPAGVVQIVAEVRSPDVTRMLLRIAEDEATDVAVRARAAGSIEADEQWERDALVALVKKEKEIAVRVAAAQTIGAFAPPAYVLAELAPLADDPAPAMRAALLWALQLAARPIGFADADRSRAESLVRSALGDPDALVRKRAAYVAGNLDAASLVPDLVELARREPERADLRLAAFVALGEIGSPARFADLVHLWNREENADVLGAASRALERAVGAPDESPRSAPPSLARVNDRVKKLLASDDARARTAAARVAGLTSAVSIDVLTALVEDQPPRVREQAVAALGRIATPECEPALLRALGDADPAIQERAAIGLLAIGSTARVLDFVARTADRAAAVRIVQRVSRPTGDATAFLEALDAALGRAGPDHPIYEPLLERKVSALEATRAAPTSARGLDATITALFPTWPRLSAARGFEPLARSLRTAETLFTSADSADSDCAGPIVLFTKCLEGYIHAWLAPRFAKLQQHPATLWEIADRCGGASWPSYQRWLTERWTDPVAVGALSVEVPLRSAPNALKKLQERRLESLDSPLSVTEWGRLILFFAVDHPSGAKNVLEIASRSADKTARLAHRLQVLAQVRNAVTHRSVAGRETLVAFRKAYYSAFEELTSLA
jgi:HEAT repeat protein